MADAKPNDSGSRLSARERKMMRADGWSNVLTGMGLRATDKSKHTHFRFEGQMTQNQLEAMYAAGGFAKRIVDLPAHEMTREWFEVQGDTNGDMLKALKKLGAKKKFKQLLKWSRLYGSALGVIVADDSAHLDAPLNENNISRIAAIQVFDRYQVFYNWTDMYMDPLHEKFGQPEFYHVMPYHTGQVIKVHETRVLRFDGAEMPDRLRYVNLGFGFSELQMVYEELKRVGSSYSSVETILQEFVTKVLTIDNLQEMIESGQDDLIQKRLSLMDMTAHINNTQLLGKGEAMVKVSSTVTGIPDLIDKFVQALSAVSGIPVTLLMGESPAGLNATGDSDIRNFYDSISSQQEEKVLPQAERLVHLLMKAKQGPTRGRVLRNWTIKFNPLWQLTEKEIAETRKLVADTDAIYLDRQVLKPQEVADSRFGGDHYSLETKTDGSKRPDNVNMNDAKPTDNAGQEGSKK
jgi:phage-related protein (TIGR01555 family)